MKPLVKVDAAYLKALEKLATELDAWRSCRRKDLTQTYIASDRVQKMRVKNEGGA